MLQNQLKTNKPPVLDAETHLAYVHLNVSNLEQSLAFYQEALGLRIHWREEDSAGLGAGKEDLLLLTERPGTSLLPHHSGLYHFAILVPSRPVLAQMLQHFIDIRQPLEGMSDHLVSEALYLRDPDGLGIEVYCDRPRAEWQFDNGTVRMSTEALNYQDLLEEPAVKAGLWQGLPADTVLGHVHLHVSSLPQAQEFYQLLGFDQTAALYKSAAFFSAGGYHHHIAVNTWNGEGVPPQPYESVGLRYFVVQLCNEHEMEQLAERLEESGTEFQHYPDGIALHDPSRNGVVFTVNNPF